MLGRKRVFQLCRKSFSSSFAPPCHKRPAWLRCISRSKAMLIFSFSVWYFNCYFHYFFPTLKGEDNLCINIKNKNYFSQDASTEVFIPPLGWKSPIIFIFFGRAILIKSSKIRFVTCSWKIPIFLNFTIYSFRDFNSTICWSGI